MGGILKMERLEPRKSRKGAKKGFDAQLRLQPPALRSQGPAPHGEEVCPPPFARPKGDFSVFAVASFALLSGPLVQRSPKR